MSRWPIANWVVLALMAVVFCLELGDTDALLPMVLYGWTFTGLFGYIWLHADVLHLLGNMLFLWVFGNAVCAKVGNVFYPLIFVLVGVLAGMVHLVFSADPVIGASGAINGIIGMYLVLYPQNSVSCVYWYFRPGRFSLAGFWLILLWFAFDIFGAVVGQGQVAYWAHLAGFAAGFALAFALVWTRRLDIEPYEKSLVQIFGLLRSAAPAAGRFSPAPAAAPASSLRHSDVSPPRAASADEFLRIHCSCGRTLKAPRAFIGKSVRCPVCSQEIRVTEKLARGA